MNFALKIGFFFFFSFLQGNKNKVIKMKIKGVMGTEIYIYF